MADTPFTNIWEAIEKINGHIRSVRVVTWLMIAYAESESVADIIQQTEVGDIGNLIGNLAEEMREATDMLEEALDTLKQSACPS